MISYHFGTCLQGSRGPFKARLTGPSVYMMRARAQQTSREKPIRNNPQSDCSNRLFRDSLDLKIPLLR
jgi:hypothetical protein